MWPFSKKEEKNKEVPNKEVKAKDEKRSDGQPHIEVEANICKTISEEVDFLKNRKSAKKYSAMKQSAFFAAINLISNGVAQMHWEVKSKTDKNIIPESYIDDLFKYNNLTRFNVVKNIIRDVLMFGNGFAYIHRDGFGKPKRIEYVPYYECDIMYNPVDRLLAYRMPMIKEGLIFPEDVLHVLINSENGIYGLSILYNAYNTIQLSGHADQSAEEFFASGMQLQGVLSTEQPIVSDESLAQIKRQWRSSQLGDGSGIAVLEAGMRYQNVSINTRDAQLLETRQFNITEVARWFNISPVLLGDYSKTAYNTIEQAQLQFVVNTLAPYIVEFEEELNRKLILPSDKSKMYIDIIEEDIIALDMKARAEVYGIYTDKAIMTPNEIRQKLGLPPVEGGDILYRPFTDINQNTIGGGKDKETDKNNENNDV